MNKYILLLLALLASPVHAATFTTNFESIPWWSNDSDPNYCRHIGTQAANQQSGTITNGGITATFGSSFAWSRALTEASSVGCSYYGGAIDPDWGAAAVGLFRNAPSGTKCARICWDCAAAADFDSRSIKFSSPVHFISFYYSGSVYQDAWACDSPYLLRFDGSVHDFNVHAIDENHAGSTGTVAGRGIELWQGGTVRVNHPPTAVDGFVSPCYTQVADNVMDYTHVHDPYCNWQYVELYSPYPIDRLYFRMQTSYYDPFYLDDLVVSDGACANPPCEFERARIADPDAVSYTGSTDSPQPIPLNLVVKSPGMKRTSWGQLKVIYR